jgi:hypothetical protein
VLHRDQQVRLSEGEKVGTEAIFRYDLAYVDAAEAVEICLSCQAVTRRATEGAMQQALLDMKYPLPLEEHVVGPRVVERNMKVGGGILRLFGSLNNAIIWEF